MVDPVQAAAPLPQRMVVLGASNVFRGVSTIVETSQGLLGTPLDLVAATGHGRSYGLASTVLCRTLPPILNCGLWAALESRPAVSTTAVITDIGNDILYEASAAQITDWIDESLRRLRRFTERIVMTELPLSSVESLGPNRFRLMRTLLFPRSRLTLSAVRDTAFQLNRNLLQLGQQYGATVVQPKSEWYGIDPIHIKQKFWRQAWPAILRSLPAEERDVSCPEGSLWRWLRLRCARPAEQQRFGIVQRRSQPAVILKNGTAVSFY